MAIMLGGEGRTHLAELVEGQGGSYIGRRRRGAYGQASGGLGSLLHLAVREGCIWPTWWRARVADIS